MVSYLHDCMFIKQIRNIFKNLKYTYINICEYNYKTEENNLILKSVIEEENKSFRLDVRANCCSSFLEASTALL